MKPHEQTEQRACSENPGVFDKIKSVIEPPMIYAGGYTEAMSSLVFHLSHVSKVSSERVAKRTFLKISRL